MNFQEAQFRKYLNSVGSQQSFAQRYLFFKGSQPRRACSAHAEG